MEEKVKQEEHLSTDFLEIVTDRRSSIRIKNIERPTDSFHSIMEYARNIIYRYHSIDEENTVNIIHSKITIDGSFLSFCKEKGVKVECLLSDGLTTWKAGEKHEHFIALGIYYITAPGLSFYHSALMHKAHSYEDEVSFFITVGRSDVDKYIAFRNEYEEWENKRDFYLNEVEVVGGEPYSYSKSLTWDDLFLDKSTKESIINFVEGFLNRKELYQKNNIPWKRGALFWGPRGNGKTTALKVIMSMYDLKPVTVYTGSGDVSSLLEHAFDYAEDHYPALLFFEDMQEMMQRIDSRHFLNLLDGAQAREGLLIIGTGNDFSSLEENITNRPRRFDKKIMFPLPDEKLATNYVKHWFKKISNKFAEKIAKEGCESKFTMSHFQEIYFSAMDIAIRNDRENPTQSDILEAMSEVSEDKRIFETEGSAEFSIQDYIK